MDETAVDFYIAPLSENTISIDFKLSGIVVATPELTNLIGRCRQALVGQYTPVIFDCVASYVSLLVYYDFTRISFASLAKNIENTICDQIENPSADFTSRKTIEIPVYYSLKTGPDLQRISSLHQLSIDDVIRTHSEAIYTVYAIGFSPAFPYLGFVEDRLKTPRLSNPRANVAKGSIGIADNQTGIYPADSPGGWNIVGRTPKNILDLSAQPQLSCPFEVGDQVKFNPITLDEYLSRGGKLEDE